MPKAKQISLSDASNAGITLIESSQKGNQATYNLILAYRNNRRTGSACAKTRAEVRGSGRKIYRQKGTGNARHGDRRAPIFVGGGVAFGPRPRSYEKKVSKRERKLAFSKVLTQLIQEGAIFTIPQFVIEDGKTKTFLATLKQFSEAKNVLVVSKGFDEMTYLSARNIKEKRLVLSSEVTIEDLLLAEVVLFTEESLPEIATRTNKK